ncbi:ArdC-like ssDNA-binding domain-containing protein [Halorussus gelatinilyticus]|uniref:ArdC-like ssDNA-binding domain-containing protein n=1 Tax=Halorussus gelatinilyticus TaxID=2937524 RepID=A0A8U0IDI5_9EURY|nr:ArdC-like ssDNA-binding domain-containing protein [Halorussus gelatinilyticus]UPV98967.1 ArdC-like ssDNA-binding domain-containing protein [Halorussus gelatinilyticus]
MTTTDDETVSFAESDDRSDEMHSTIEAWIEDLLDRVDEATASTEFQTWLDVQSRFHGYSHRNTLLIKLQCPEATRVAGYRTWQTEFDRHVEGGEEAIWIWAPIITRKCPDCGSSPSYHERSDCTYDETPSEDWSKGLVGFRPTAVFDVSQTEGEPLPELDTAATGDAEALVPTLLAGAKSLGVEARVVSVAEWSHGDAKGVCQYNRSEERAPVVEVKARANSADLAVTLVHEYAHALLHIEREERSERSKREVEAEAVGYVVGRYFGLDTSGSALYLAAWRDEDAEVVLDRLGRIRETASEIIEKVDGSQTLNS